MLLCEGEFVSAFWAFCSFALYVARAASACEGSSIDYVEFEAAFWAL
jgi:hypothetical protein